jgi:hypothetical protein
MPSIRQDFICADGHYLSGPNDYRPKKCPAYVHGKPCKGQVTAVGAGARKVNNELEVS